MLASKLNFDNALFLALTLLVVTSEAFQKKYTLNNGTTHTPNLQLFVTEAEIKIYLVTSHEDRDDEPIFTSTLVKPVSSEQPHECSDGDICLQWNNHKLSITRQTPQCAEMHLVAADESIVCNSLESAQWYGGPSVRNQLWPIQKMNFSESPYITGGGEFLGVIESYWLSSKGIALYVAEDAPLFITQNASELCFINRIDAPYVSRDDTDKVEWRYSVCQAEDARQVHLHAVQNLLGYPKGVPDERMIQYPVWSTWARYKKYINESVVRQLADEILFYGFNNSQLEIDEMWETCFGDAVFDASKFSDPAGLVQGLHDDGFRVTLWNAPFVNLDCETHSFATDNGYLVHYDDGEPITVTWWEGAGAIIDFTNAEATDWWRNRLIAIRDNYSIESFKFDAGEVFYFPTGVVIHAPPELQPNIFTTMYINETSYFGTAVETRVVRRNQELPQYVRMQDKDTTWGDDNGLKTLVTSLLQMNLNGYPFVLPDMIGGNGYGTSPTKELFIRWLQANTFMPSIQFSYVPWDFDNETVEISLKYAALHAQYSETIVDLATKSTQDGSPINPPIWWIDPTNEEAQKIDSEYLLGENLLVAPILEEGATSRDIYLPTGDWRDELRPFMPTISGPAWLLDYPAALDELPYFTKIN